MSGQGTRYQKAGYTDPKPLIAVNGIPMIERLLEKFPLSWACTFVLAENHKDSGLVELLKKLRPTSQILFVTVHQQGPAFPLEQSLSYLPEDAGLLVSYCDYGLCWDPWHFQDFVSYTDCEACLISYRGFHAHYLSPVPYAYSRLTGELVAEVREKGSFTADREAEFASCGAYYFKNKKVLAKALSFQKQQDLKVNGEYYTSLTVEALLQSQQQAQVRIYEIPYFFQWGTPEDLKDFEYWETVFKNKNRHEQNSLKTEQILLPMAGLGSRFKALTSTSKPFIKISGVPMYEKALSCLPKADRVGIVSLEDLKPQVNEDYHFLGLKDTPAGQALTVYEGLKLLDLKKPVIVSACDHGLVINPDLWTQFLSEKWDAAVFAIKGFPGTRRSPQSYSFVETTQASENKNFPDVKKIHLKKAISNTPQKDFLLVGTFWFKSAQILLDGIEELKKENTLVNNELYLDGIFDQLAKKQLKSVVFPLDGYFNWGDPDSLKESLYWEEVFSGHTLSSRGRFPGVDFKN